jgi:cellulose biosynthesis protein BcsQ
MEACETWRNTWDWIILDLPPISRESQESLTFVADLGILIARVDPDLPSAVAGILTSLLQSKSEAIPELRILGVLRTMVRDVFCRNQEGLQRIIKRLPVEVFTFWIPWEECRFPEDPPKAGCQRAAPPSSRAGRGYVELAMEVLSNG